jgi:Tfp pilus assembly protein PilO
MGARERLILCVVVTLAAIAAVWLLLVAPERRKSNNLTGQLTSERATLAAEQAQLGVAEQARTGYRKTLHAMMVLETAVPLSDEEPQLIRQIDRLEKGHKIKWGTTSLTPGTATAAGFPALTVSFTFDSSFINLQRFLYALDSLTQTDGTNLAATGRLATVNSLNLSATEGMTQAQVDITVYQLETGAGATGATGTAAPTTTTSAP